MHRVGAVATPAEVSRGGLGQLQPAFLELPVQAAAHGRVRQGLGAVSGRQELGGVRGVAAHIPQLSLGGGGGGGGGRGGAATPGRGGVGVVGPHRRLAQVVVAFQRRRGVLGPPRRRGLHLVVTLRRAAHFPEQIRAAAQEVLGGVGALSVALGGLLLEAVEVELALEAAELAVAEVLDQHVLGEALHVENHEAVAVVRPPHHARILRRQHVEQLPRERLRRAALAIAALEAVAALVGRGDHRARGGA
eukprot:scaffold578_cov243-Pinguiococcus_pyrenoidosus.AAC.28